MSREITENLPLQHPPRLAPQLTPNVSPALHRALEEILSLQRTDGYWWFTLEANETIGAGFIFAMSFLDAVDKKLMHGIAHRIRDVQRPDGTWALYHKGPAELSATIECYLALKLAGDAFQASHMRKAREFILKHGGIEKARVFTRIHLALFGIIPWTACPKMPVEMMLLPEWFPVNIYEFSSWARASIVPLLILLSLRPTKKLSVDLEELFVHPPKERDFSFKSQKLISWDQIFIHLDKSMKAASRIPFKPMRPVAIEKARKWIIEHHERVEDIFPALAYGALALKALGFKNDSPEIRKPFEALLMFQQHYTSATLPRLPEEVRDDGVTPASVQRRPPSFTAFTDETRIHQQCCISPAWDTPWTATALLEAGLPADHPSLLKTARWLLKKQIRDLRGDWSIKCPNVEPGGWAFEFENDYFPDVDDTIQVLHVLKRVALSEKEKREPCERALKWMRAMQNDDGGWGAFDRNNNLEIVNKIPFADHGACLDPSSPDITGRMIELLALYDHTLGSDLVHRAIQYLIKTQEPFGGWFGRWGVNYIYGTWAVLTGMSKLNAKSLHPLMNRGVEWLKSIQHRDGGWGESPASYDAQTFVPWEQSVPSQTAWALMGLVAAGEAASPEVEHGMAFLLNRQNEQGVWDEEEFTGTGFPSHFYIRYHGYRHFFPLLALARYNAAISSDIL